MTIFDGHGRTPHDMLEQILSGAAMICCLPCLCIVAFTKFVSRISKRGEKSARKEETESARMNGSEKVEVRVMADTETL